MVFRLTFLMPLHIAVLKGVQEPNKLAKTVTFLAFRRIENFLILHAYFQDMRVDIGAHSFRRLSYDRSIDSSRANSSQSVI